MANPVNSRPIMIMYGSWANTINNHPMKHGHSEILNVNMRPSLSNEIPMNRHPNGAAIDTLLAVQTFCVLKCMVTKFFSTSNNACNNCYLAFR